MMSADDIADERRCHDVLMDFHGFHAMLKPVGRRVVYNLTGGFTPKV